MTASTASESSLSDVARGVARRWRLLIAVFTPVFGVIAIYTLNATPRYRSEAVLRIESKRSNAPSLPEDVSSMPGLGLLGLDRDELETEIGLLRSRFVTDAMIDTVALTVRVTNPADGRASVLTVKTASADADVRGRLTLTRDANASYAVAVRDLTDSAGVPDHLAPGDSMRVGGVLLTLSPALRAGGPARIDIALYPRYRVHELLEKRLRIRRQEGGSRLVEIAYEDPDRVLAKRVVDRIVAEYVAYTARTERNENGVTVDQLRAEAVTTRAKLVRAEAALREFQETSRLVVPEEQASAQIKRIGQLSGQLDAFGIERAALSQLLALIEQRSREGSDATAYRQLATFPSLISNRAIQDLLQALIVLENDRAALGVRRTQRNDEYDQFTRRIGELEQQLFRLGSQYLESLDQQLSTTIRAVTTLTDTLQLLPAGAMEYGRRVRERALYEAEYLLLQKQLKQSELQELLRKDRVKIIDVPRVSHVDDPAFPRKAVMLALGAIVATSLAFGAALAREL